jgi:hypothetical protein
MIPYEQLELTIKNYDLIIPAQITLVNCWCLCITKDLRCATPRMSICFHLTTDYHNSPSGLYYKQPITVFKFLMYLRSIDVICIIKLISDDVIGWTHSAVVLSGYLSVHNNTIDRFWVRLYHIWCDRMAHPYPTERLLFINPRYWRA